MKKYYHGRLRRVVMLIGSERRAACDWWHGERRIWPDDSARSNALRIRLPERGTLDWAYWVHAVEAVRSMGAADDCYLRMKVGNKYYYLIDSPDGSVPLELDGGMAYFEGDESFPTDELGLTVDVEAVVPTRYGGRRWVEGMIQSVADFEFWQDEEHSDKFVSADGTFAEYDYIWSSRNALLPILPDVLFISGTSKGRGEETPMLKYVVSGIPSGEVYYSMRANWHGGRGLKKNYWQLPVEPDGGRVYEVVNNLQNGYKSGDWGFSVGLGAASTGGESKDCGLCVVFANFSRKFVLDVVSVNTAE